MLTAASFDEAFRIERSTGNAKRLKLNRAQAQKWEETRAAVSVACPMFIHILFSMLTPEDRESKEMIAYFTDQVPIAATDAYEIFLNPGPYFEMTLEERIFVLVHEILHPVLNHNAIMKMCRSTGKVVTQSGKTLPYDQQIMNQAMDYPINHLLVTSDVGKPPQNICLDPRIGTYMESCIDVYAKLYEQKKSGGGAGGGAAGAGGLGSDVLEPGEGQPGDEQGKPKDGRGEGEWQVAVSAAAQAAKAQGKLPAALEQVFGEVIEPQVSWSDHIVGFFARKVGSGGYDWKHPDQQLICRGLGVLEGVPIYAPSRSGFGAGTIVVGMDSSGSIYADPTLIDRFMGELAGILSDIRPKRIVVIWCDAAVQRIDEVEDAEDLDVIRMKGAKGGGGTNFIPVFNEIVKLGLDPDALIYLTDGDGDFPFAVPPYPVLWGNITKHYGPGKPYPFGEVVTIPLQ